MILHDVEVEGRAVDVRVGDGRVAEIAGRHCLHPMTPDEIEIEGDGGALLPGLHDHHLHLRATAAARASIDLRDGLEPLRTAPGARLRGVLLPDSVERHALDHVVADRPVRVQHRSGALWMLNSLALAELHPLPDHPGVERDDRGEPTGRLWRLDHLLRGTWPPAGDLNTLGLELSRLGVTGVTDATPDLTAAPPVPQHVTVLGRRKLHLHDHDLPTYDELHGRVAALHAAGQPVAVHCVTRQSLLLTLAVLDDVGRLPGDRIEHASVVPDPALLRGLTVVTQPGFVAERAAAYERDVDPDDLPHLYRYASLLAAGVLTLPSSDAPYGTLDPWAIMRAASTRELLPHERVSSETVLDGYLTGPDLRPRRVVAGAAADLVLLRTNLAEALDALDSSVVRSTWIEGSASAMSCS